MAVLDEKVRAFLEDRHLAVIATINPDGTPQQTAVWYVLDGDELLMNTVQGRIKEDWVVQKLQDENGTKMVSSLSKQCVMI